MSRHLFLQIYAAFAAVLLACVVAIGLAAHLTRPDEARVPRRLAVLAGLAIESLPPESSRDALREALAARGERLGLDLSLWDADRRLLAGSGLPVAPPSGGGATHRWVRRHGRLALQVRLDDGRWLVAALPRKDPADQFHHFLGFLALVGLLAAIGCLPVAHRITRRLQRLRQGVERLGGGDLSARVEVRGRDEVAELAIAFNRAAERIEGLVRRQRRVLASASHELRSPLARIRMALALLDPGDDPARRDYLEGAVRDVTELDELIEHLLLTARLEATGPLPDPQPVDLSALLAEQAARAGATVLASEPVTVPGDPRMLGLLLRNLLDNGRRHGGGSEVEAHVASEGDEAVVIVQDRGPGIPLDLRERVFEPFFRRADHKEGQDGGVGLGLALAREIARHHGGDVRCEGREGGGSRFLVTLPIG